MLADESQDPNLLRIFKAGADFHKTTTARLMGKPEDQVTPEERQVSKAILFAIQYNVGNETICNQARLRFGLGWQKADARRFLQSFDELTHSLPITKSGL